MMNPVAYGAGCDDVQTAHKDSSQSVLSITFTHDGTRVPRLEFIADEWKGCF